MSAIKFIISFFLLVSSSYILAQVSEPKLSGELYTPPNRFANSQYYFDGWLTGHIIMTSGEIATNRKIQYNAYLDEVFWLHCSLYRHVRLDRKLIKGFTVNTGDNNQVEFKRMHIEDSPGLTKDIFVEVLHNDAISLYSRRIYRESSNIRSATVGGVIVSRIVLMRDFKYFLELQDGSIIQVNRNRRSLYQSFPVYRSEISKLLRQSRNRIRTDEDFINAVRQINNIVHPPSH
jgi:hypothetical protein